MEVEINNIDDLISIVNNSTYITAFTSIQSYFQNNIENIFAELDVLTFNIYQHYADYNNACKPILDDIQGRNIIRTIEIVQSIFENTSELSSINDYKSILNYDDFCFILTIFTKIQPEYAMNTLVGLNKYNMLLHKIKNRLIPQYCK